MRSTPLFLLFVVAGVVFCQSAAAAPAWKRLGVERATSTSYLQSNWNKYDENYGLEELSQYLPDDVLAAFAGPGAAFFEATKDSQSLGYGVTRSRYAVTFDEKDKKRAKSVSFHQRTETHEREDYVENKDVALDFDDKGLLVMVRTKSVEDNSDGVSVSLITFERDEAGRIKAVTVKAANGGTVGEAGLANTTYTARFTAQQPGA